MIPRHSLAALGIRLGISLAVAAGACARRIEVPELPLLDSPAFTAATREPEPKPDVAYVEVPKPMPLPGQLKPLSPSAKGTDNPEAAAPILSAKERIAAAQRRARVEPSKDGYINAIQVYPYTRGALYQLYAAVNQVTDIGLEPGEKLVSVSAGDTVRWIVGDTSSGEGKDAIVHILVKPTAADLDTNLVITTDRRTYHLEMHATAATYMASLTWTYPAAELVALKRQRVEAANAAAAIAEGGVNLENLRFRYRLEGDAPFKPRQVFDDGAKVYIQFPPGLAQSEAPPLFVLGPDGNSALVNYRVRGTTYIVDRLFAAAELRLGTAPQRIVRIIRTDAVWREGQP